MESFSKRLSINSGNQFPSSCDTHLASTSSPTNDRSSDNNDKNINIKPDTMLEKIERNAPYNIFFTTIADAPQTKEQPNAISFTDLLCPSLGVLKCSLQINFILDIDWLLKQYKKRDLSSKPLTILYGDEKPHMETFIKMFCPNVTTKLVKMTVGCHHSKIGIYVYEDDSIRVVISTANLYYQDWNCYNQGLWVSPTLPRLPDSSSSEDGESRTLFKTNLISYLRNYQEHILEPFIQFVQKADFSAVRVFFIYSFPGKYYPGSNGSHLHAVADLLSRYVDLPANPYPHIEDLAWEVIAQSSSLGSMGRNPGNWLKGSILRCLASHKGNIKPLNSDVSISIVYPSFLNVISGYCGHKSGWCLPYLKEINEQQRWLQDYMCQWKSDCYGRTRAMPHIKTYCRVSPCFSKLAYFLLTSANLSRSAWGINFGRDMGVIIRNYEAGVLFLPTFFDEEFFEISNTSNDKNKKLFPFMYDLPLTPYREDDYPWCN